jgi:hypothetical protein
MIRENHMTVRGVQMFRCRDTDPILKSKRAQPFYSAPERFGFRHFASEAALVAAIRGGGSMKTAATTPERKFALIKIEAGDYLLPGNNATTLWRIRRGAERHIAENGLDEIERPAWELWRWMSRLTDTHALEQVDPGDWSQWEYQETDTTRQKVIDRAMELEPKNGGSA